MNGEDIYTTTLDMPAPAPVKEPETKPAPTKDPSTNPRKDNDPWNVPAPDVNPTPKA